MKKRTTFILAIASLLACTVFAAACEDTPPEACEHEGGTATCIQRAVCEKCGEEYGELADHAYGAWQHDGTKHWKECTTEGCNEKSEEGNHTGGTATCQEKATCEACGEEYGELGTHSYTKWKSDGNEHWKECVCGAKSDKAAHAFTEWKSDEAKHWQVCVCGAETAKAAHEYGAWQHDGDKHWKECTTEGCNARSEESNHTGGTATCQNKAVCDACHEAYGDLATHSFGAWQHDETKHWKECLTDGCNEKSEEGNHDGGTATCQNKATCEACGEEYGELASHSYGAWQHDDAQHWKECTTDGCNERSETGNHVYNVWDKSDAAVDYATCECGAGGTDHPFDKTVARITQKLLLTDETVKLNLVGVSEYASVVSIAFGEYDLGTNLSALSISDELKADTVHHGRQTIVVTVKGADDAEHAVNVPVTFITKEIASADDFKAIQPATHDKDDNVLVDREKSIYGYYVLTNNISDTSLAYNSICKSWDETISFFGTFDGQGHTITAAANGAGGLFGILRGATIKNLTVKDNWRTGGNGGSVLLARGSFNSTLENVTFTYVNGGTPDMSLDYSSDKSHGWICCTEFSNNTLINVTVNDSSDGYGSLFGNKFTGNVFNNVVINGTYTEMGHTADDKSVLFDDVTKSQQIKLDGRQDFVLDGNVSVIDLGEYSDCEILSITTSTGYELFTLSSDAVNDVFKAAKQAHGEQDFIIKVSRNGEVIILSVPVTVITKEITSAADFKAIQPSAETKGVYGYYVLTTNISDNTLAQSAYADDWAATTGFFGTFDGRGHTISTAANGAKGIFGILRGATIKNLTITDNWRSAYQNYALLAKACFNSTIKDVTFTYVAGNTQANVGNGYGWLSCAEFSNNMLINVTVNDTQGYGSLFGYKFTDNVFNNVTINGTYTEMGHTASGESVSYDDVTKVEA